jgi:hypothetical protein
VTPEQIEALEAIPGKGVFKDNWSQLFVAIKEKGIAPASRGKNQGALL